MRATPLKKIIPTAIDAQLSAASQDWVSLPPAKSIRKPPRAQRTNPAAIAMWIAAHQGVPSSTEGFSSNPPEGGGWKTSPTATNRQAKART